MKAVPKAAAKGVMKVVKAKAKAKAKAKPGGKLKGKSLCFTGALAIKRSVATSLAKAQGAKVTSSVSKSTAPWKVSLCSEPVYTCWLRTFSLLEPMRGPSIPASGI